MVRITYLERHKVLASFLLLFKFSRKELMTPPIFRLCITAMVEPMHADIIRGSLNVEIDPSKCVPLYM